MARTPIHPGEILAGEPDEIGLSAKKLADVIEVPPNRLYQLLAGKRNVTAHTALRLVPPVPERNACTFASGRAAAPPRRPALLIQTRR
jgi:addiction module HigA family antidote